MSDEQENGFERGQNWPREIRCPRRSLNSTVAVAHVRIPWMHGSDSLLYRVPHGSAACTIVCQIQGPNSTEHPGSQTQHLLNHHALVGMLVLYPWDTAFWQRWCVQIPQTYSKGITRTGPGLRSGEGGGNSILRTYVEASGLVQVTKSTCWFSSAVVHLVAKVWWVDGPWGCLTFPKCQTTCTLREKENGKEFSETSTHAPLSGIYSSSAPQP